MMVGGIKTLVGLQFSAWPAFSVRFLFVHMYLATLGHTPLEHFKQMWDGWEEEEVEEELVPGNSGGKAD